MFWRGIADDEAYLAVIRAYNEWLAEEYCAYSPNRLIAMGVLPDTGVDDAVAEMEYCAKAGLKGVNLHRFPAGQSYVTRDDDRFWEAAVDLEMPIASHTFGGTTRLGNKGPIFIYPDGGGPKSERDPVTLLFRFAGEQPIAPLQMAMAGVFDRLPELRVYWAESQCGWLPYSFDQIDDNYERNRYWGERDYGIKATARRPSEYLRDNCLWGFMRDPWGVKCRRGDRREHPVVGQRLRPRHRQLATFPGRHRRDLRRRVTEEERYAMLAGNAIEFFRLDAAVDLEREPGATHGGYGDRRIESWRTSTSWCKFLAS